MSIRKIRKSNIPLANTFLSKEYLILKYSQETAEALLKAFDNIRTNRHARGAPTDKEQDILRAMIVLVAGGFDSMLKQLVRNAIPHLAKTNKNIKKLIEEYVEKKIRIIEEFEANRSSNKFLARILTADSQQSQILSEYVNELTSGSLQSVAEFSRVVDALDIEKTFVQGCRNDLKKIFEERNKIVHEFDIIFNVPGRNRNARSRKTMVDYTNKLLEISETILSKIGNELKHFPSGV